MSVIIDVIEEEKRRLEQLQCLYENKLEKRYKDKLMSVKKNLKLCEFLLDAYENYKE